MADSLLSYITPSSIASNVSTPLDQVTNASSLVSKGLESNLKAITPNFEYNNNLFDSEPKDISDMDFKVRLVSILDMNRGYTDARNQVVFEVTPSFSESRSVEYAPIQPIHMPGSVQVYKFTNSRVFDLTAHFISRSVEDARTNMKYLQRLRSWTMPFFGNSETAFTEAANPNTAFQLSADRIINGNNTTRGKVNLLGAPPEVLYLYGYSPTIRATNRNSVAAFNINRIPVVLTNLNINYPEDVDYIPTTLSATSKTEPFPVKMDVTLSLTETHSPVEYQRFSLDAFKAGTLTYF